MQFIKNKKIIGILLFLVIIIFTIGIIQFFVLRKAHSTFENYYKFRGCVQLIEKTNTYGTCKLSSGQIIKLVKYKDKWYLDGDLPYPGFNFL
ncbi:MAG TPA: hypothetical protein VMR49_02980 [Candidatus Paceibacterota bacterium]|nr:hypothetical protein [Candidatus Paceibacterota bacterium]